MKEQKVFDSFAEGLSYVVEQYEAIARKMLPPITIGVAGGSASGKGVFIEKLIAQHPDLTTVLSMDDYYHKQEYRREQGITTYDEPGALDLSLFSSHFATLWEGETIYDAPSYWDKTRDPRTIRSAPLIIADGIFVFLPQVMFSFHISIFLKAPKQEMLLRRIERDIERTGQTPREIARMFVEEVYPAYKKYVLPSAARADVIVHNDWRSGGDLSNFSGIEEWVEKLERI